MTLPRMTGALALSLIVASAASAQHQIVCSGEAAGGYAAFPTFAGSRMATSTASYTPVTATSPRPTTSGPRAGASWPFSTDNGKTWSKPIVAIDTDLDDRDPSVACLKDGTLLLNWFTVQKNQAAVMLARSTDNGKTWSEPMQLKLDSPYSFACSSPFTNWPMAR